MNISEGEVYAVTYIVSGSTHFVAVVNPGTPDGSTYFRFSCLVSMISYMKSVAIYCCIVEITQSNDDMQNI